MELGGAKPEDWEFVHIRVQLELFREGDFFINFSIKDFIICISWMYEASANKLAHFFFLFSSTSVHFLCGWWSSADFNFGAFDLLGILKQELLSSNFEVESLRRVLRFHLHLRYKTTSFSIGDICEYIDFIQRLPHWGWEPYHLELMKSNKDLKPNKPGWHSELRTGYDYLRIPKSLKTKINSATSI